MLQFSLTIEDFEKIKFFPKKVDFFKVLYKYDPKNVNIRELDDFSPALKEAIFKKEGYKGVLCGRGQKEGFELHADHIKPKDFGGEATLENGQTLSLNLLINSSK